MEFSSEGGMIQLDSSLESAPRYLLHIQNNIWSSVLTVLKSAESGIMYKLLFNLECLVYECIFPGYFRERSSPTRQKE